MDNKHGFSIPDVTQNPENLVLKEQVFPGMAGYPAMYIRHLTMTFRQEQYFIVSMTDYELDDAKKTEIINDAIEFLQQQN
ncbi:hypothetical protein [Nostoc sp. NIES-3756]|uniref:hypothetical protein n=1 Tax=Nostoc sp. NIES-3756 TaxID=1751286 RepID=UPI0011E046E8|nr:hypothetical protein [Nostoc sp. NIES-3756]